MVACGDATTIAGFRRRVCVPCPQSRGGAGAVLPDGKGLRGLREGAARGEGATADAFAGVVRAAEHWHLVLWPRADGHLSEFMRWLSVTHTQRWHAAHHTSGKGALYQGRFKSFPIQEDEHLLTVSRYVERNALRRSWSHRRRRGVGAACGIGSTASPRGWWTRCRCRCRGIGGGRCRCRRGRPSWRRCGNRWCGERPSARRPGRRKRASDCTWNRHFAHVAARGRLRRPRLPKRFKIADPF